MTSSMASLPPMTSFRDRFVAMDRLHDGNSNDDDVSSVASESGGEESAPTKSNRDRDREFREQLIHKEEEQVRRARLCVLVVAVAAALAVCISIFVFSRQNDFDTFEVEYEVFATEILEHVQWEVQHNFDLNQMLSASITASALMTNQSFPFVTLESWEVLRGRSDGRSETMSSSAAFYVSGSQQDKWESYSVQHQDWLAESKQLEKLHPKHRDDAHAHRILLQDRDHDRRLRVINDLQPKKIQKFIPHAHPERSLNEAAIPNIHGTIYRWDHGRRVPDTTTSPDQIFAPMWQLSPAESSAVNVNLLSDVRVAKLHDAMLATRQSVMSQGFPIDDLFDFAFDPEEKDQKKEPHAILLELIYSSFEEDKANVGFLTRLISWRNLLARLLPEGSNALCVLKDSCGNVMTYELRGQEAIFLGYDDYHDPDFDSHERSARVEFYGNGEVGLCVHRLHVYPTRASVKSHRTNQPILYTGIVAMAFAVLCVVVIFYDNRVTRRQEKTMKTAINTNRIVASLFPERVRRRLIDEAMRDEEKKKISDKKNIEEFLNGRSRYLNGADSNKKSRPIAEYFPNTTILFADIAGFTAWASSKEPHQVFELLETLYGEFDAIAKRRKVFKVETIGDCYVAVTGLPTARKDHAVLMAKFAHECMIRMGEITEDLEETLGPDTSNLAFRVGIHSGPVTAGVLRGENARFQLFGTTMNQASRMESTGIRGNIQISSATADLLVKAGKGHWLQPREDKVEAKGIGKLQTYWLKVTSDGPRSSVPSVDGLRSSMHSKRSSIGGLSTEDGVALDSLDNFPLEIDTGDFDRILSTKHSDETASHTQWIVIALLERLKLMQKQRSGNSEIDTVIKKELETFVAGITSMYNANPFHNFEHASHVALSANKIMARVAGSMNSNTGNNGGNGTSSLNYQQAFDPFLQFGILFSAIIHDAGHLGVPNTQLQKESVGLYTKYGKSLAENSSIELGWHFFSLPEFEHLRTFVCPTPTYLSCFRALITNIVLATDIADTDLKADRNARWEQAFSDHALEKFGPNTVNDMRLKIVVEHIIQASDVCHTMQHWHIYQEWNEKLFEEMYKAYEEGRAEKNPAEFWYSGELGFFDFYVIPLATKLAGCGVFGVSSNEFLNFATENRREWKAKGQFIVAEYVEKYCFDHGD